MQDQPTRRSMISGLGLGGAGFALTVPQISSGGPIQARGAGLVQLTPGLRQTDRPMIVSGYGQFVLSGGASHLEGVGRDGSLIVGAATEGATDRFQPIVSGAQRGENAIRPASTTGYYVGQTVLVTGGRSQNSSLGNSIPKAKQFLTVTAVDHGNGTLRFSTPLGHDVVPTDEALVSRPDTPFAVASTVQNLRVGALRAPNVVYTHAVQFSYVVSIRDTVIEGDAASGFVAFSDHVVYDNVAFSGYSGISCARGTKRVVWRDCSYAPRAHNAEGYCAFLEESPESAVVENFRAWGGQFKITNSSDDDNIKNIYVRNLDLRFDGKVVRNGRAIDIPAVEIIFAASSESAVRFEDGAICTPGGSHTASDREIPRCGVYIYSSRNVRLSGLSFSGLRPDAYAIAVDGANCFGLEIVDCAIVDGSGRGLCHPSVLANMRTNPAASTLRAMKQLEIALPQGRVFVTWQPELGVITCDWPSGPSRSIGRASSKHRHRLSLSITVGMDLISEYVDIVGGAIFSARSGQRVPESYPLRVMDRGDQIELMIAAGSAMTWRGTVQYLYPPIEDGRQFYLAWL